MGDSLNSQGGYRIEISGWGLDNGFFTERTDLLWTSGGEKQVRLHRALPEGAIVFVRLLSSEPTSGSVPVAYQVEDVVPMDRNGRCQMRLGRLHSKSKQSPPWQHASKELDGELEGEVKDLEIEDDASEAIMEMHREEILR